MIGERERRRNSRSDWLVGGSLRQPVVVTGLSRRAACRLMRVSSQCQGGSRSPATRQSSPVWGGGGGWEVCCALGSGSLSARETEEKLLNLADTGRGTGSAGGGGWYVSVCGGRGGGSDNTRATPSLANSQTQRNKTLRKHRLLLKTRGIFLFYSVFFSSKNKGSHVIRNRDGAEVRKSGFFKLVLVTNKWCATQF